MIIEFTGPTANHVDDAAKGLQALARDWDADVAITANASQQDAPRPDGEKVLDPISLTALVVSLPSTVLAVTDLTDRIRKRRRAQQLIDQARRVADNGVNATVTAPNGTLELHTLTPDEVLDLAAHDTDTDTDTDTLTD